VLQHVSAQPSTSSTLALHPNLNPITDEPKGRRRRRKAKAAKPAPVPPELTADRGPHQGTINLLRHCAYLIECDRDVDGAIKLAVAMLGDLIAARMPDAIAERRDREKKNHALSLTRELGEIVIAACVLTLEDEAGAWREALGEKPARVARLQACAAELVAECSDIAKRCVVVNTEDFHRTGTFSFGLNRRMYELAEKRAKHEVTL
jgi:hypothetical protein